MVKYSSAGNPIKPRNLKFGDGTLRCDEHIIEARIDFSTLKPEQFKRVLDWLEQAHAYLSYTKTAEFAFRKKQREDLNNGYKTQNGARGSRSQWQEKAARLRKRMTSADQSLAILGLTEIPMTIGVLKRARREAMKKAHPDRGGSEQQAQAVNEAYDIIEAKILPK